MRGVRTEGPFAELGEIGLAQDGRQQRQRLAVFGRRPEPQVPEDLPRGPFAPRGLEPASRVTLHDPGEPLVVAHHVTPFEESGPGQPGERGFRLHRRRRQRREGRLAGATAPPQPPGGGEEEQDSQREQADRPPARGHVQCERPPDVMDISPRRFGVGRQRRDHPHRRRRRLDEREFAVRRPDADRYGGNLVVAGEQEGAEPEAEPALPRRVAVRFQRSRTQDPEVAKALLDDRRRLRALAVLHDHFQFEDVPDLHGLGDDLGNAVAAGSGPVWRAAAADAAARQKSAATGKHESHRRRFSRMRKNLRRGAS